MIEQETVTGSAKAALAPGDSWNLCSGITKGAARHVARKQALPGMRKGKIQGRREAQKRQSHANQAQVNARPVSHASLALGEEGFGVGVPLCLSGGSTSCHGVASWVKRLP